MITFSDVARFALGKCTWVGGTWGKRFVELLGLVGDAMGDACLYAAMAVWVRNPYQPQDARERLAQERRMPRYPTETEAQHRARLADWRVAYEAGGSGTTLLSQVAAFGLSGGTIATHYTSGWETEPPTLHPVTGTSWWSLFWLYFPVGHGRRPAEQGWDDDDWAWDDEHGFDIEMTVAEIAGLRELIARWKPSQWVCEEVVFAMPDGSQVRLAVRDT